MKNTVIHIVDTTLRDGSHALQHQITASMAAGIAAGLASANTEYIEVSHGDGLAGSSYNYGFSLQDENELIFAAKQAAGRATIAALLIPGIGTVMDLERAVGNGVGMVRIATHVTEANTALEHMQAAKRMNLKCCGFLMMVHMAGPEEVLEQARVLEDAGADYINLADSAGHLLPQDVEARISLLAEKLSVPVGFHAHNNLGLAIANSLTAIESGATFLDATLRGLGAGAGNAQHEILPCLLRRMGYSIAENQDALFKAARECVEPIMKRPQGIDNNAIMLGSEGVYSSFMLHVESVCNKFHVNPYQVIVELGKRKVVGGQEDMITEIAYQLSH